jgi:polar amino acid transport system substrate-binding protein
MPVCINNINTDDTLNSVLRLCHICLLSSFSYLIPLPVYGVEPAITGPLVKNTVTEKHVKGHSNKTTEIIRIARGSGDFPPLEMVEERVLTGLHIDMIRHVAQKLNVEVEFTPLPWARAINYFSEGKVDAISYYGYTKEREEFAYYYPGNILSNTCWVFIVLEERKHEFTFDKSLKGLEGYIVGVQLGYSYGMYFDSMKHFERDVVADELALERMLKNRRHDLAMISYQEFLGFRQRGGFEGIVALSPTLDLDPQYLAFAKSMDVEGSRKELAKRFAEGMEAFKLSSAYKKLLNKYYTK